MQFKHPELLYGLLLLIVPILIHLFQLRRFQKVQFTNVKFLKSVELQTRKSSQIKKWLILLMRLLLLSALVIAFAQPFIPRSDNFNQNQETVIYLDNSFSMEAPGQNGSLLNEAIQDLITTYTEDQKISLFTNDKTYQNTTVKAMKNELIQLLPSAKELSYQSAVIKGKSLFSKDPGSSKNLVLISDFQANYPLVDLKSDSIVKVNLVQPKSSLRSNISIDSVYISSSSAETLDINVVLKNQGIPQSDISVSLKRDTVLIAKSAIRIEGKGEVTFTLPAKTEFKGHLSIDEQGLPYDNQFYFNINETPKIKVLVINETSGDGFLKRIYTDDEFDLQTYELNALNYNSIPEQNLIILNELDRVNSTLTSSLTTFKNEGGSVLIIPSVNIDLNSYNQLFKQLNLPFFENRITGQKFITDISYNHPLLENSFYAKVYNFKYPRVKQYYPFKNTKNSVLAYEDGQSFLAGLDGSYVFSAALNNNNSDFKSSQLIVPVFYNLGLRSLRLPRLYYTLGRSNTITIPIEMGQDDILNLISDDIRVIPRQKTYSKTVLIETDEFPSKDGLLEVQNKNRTIQYLSFNYPRTESNTNYHNLNSLTQVETYQRLSSSLNAIKSNTNVNALWKWFVIFALVCLITELLLLKYLK